MKTNRTLTTVLAALLLATTFASCSRRDQFRPPETDTPTGEQTTVAGQPDVNHPTETNPNGGEVTGPNTTTPPDIPIVTPPVSGGENGKIKGNPYEGWTAEELYQESSNYLGGDFYLCSSDGEPTCLFRLATDGIPDQFTQFLLLDGHYVLFTYQTYKDYRNSYNPNVPEWERSIRFCFVDLYTGQAYDMGVDLEEIN